MKKPYIQLIVERRSVTSIDIYDIFKLKINKYEEFKLKQTF